MINKKYQTWTRIFILVIIAAIIIYDVYIAIVGGTGTTISHEMIVWAYKYPIFPFAMGIVFGHLFWRTSQSPTLTKIDQQNAERDSW